jgi:hypothetical protein
MVIPFPMASHSLRKSRSPSGEFLERLLVAIIFVVGRPHPIPSPRQSPGPRLSLDKRRTRVGGAAVVPIASSDFLSGL